MLFRYRAWHCTQLTDPFTAQASLAALAGVSGAGGIGRTESHLGDAVLGKSMGGERLRHGNGGTLRQRDVVFTRTAVVGMALDAQQPHVRLEQAPGGDRDRLPHAQL